MSKCFIKKLPDYGTTIKDIVLRKYQIISGLNYKNIGGPSLQKIDGSVLFFSFIDQYITVNQSLRTNLLSKNNIISLGEYLAILHTRFISSFHEYNDTGIQVIHGDFFPHNILISKSKIFIIDPEPPKNKLYYHSHTFNKKELDIATFIVGNFTYTKSISVLKTIFSAVYYNFFFIFGYGNKQYINYFYLMYFSIKETYRHMSFSFRSIKSFVFDFMYFPIYCLSIILILYIIFIINIVCIMISKIRKSISMVLRLLKRICLSIKSFFLVVFTNKSWFVHSIYMQFLWGWEQFGRSEFYQSYPPLKIGGSRDIKQRFKTYELDSILKKDMEVLDIGCNTGFFSLYCSPFVKHIIAIEYNKNLYSIAERVKNYENISNVDFVNKDFKEFESSDLYDCIFSFAIHMRVGMDFQNYVRKLHGLLKSDGRLLIESQKLSLDPFEKNLSAISHLFDVIYIKDSNDHNGIERKVALLQKK